MYQKLWLYYNCVCYINFTVFSTFAADTVYVASGKHSYPPMGIVALHIATLLVVFLMLYKYMGPIAQEEEEQEAGVELGPVRPVGREYKLVSQEEEDLSSEAEGEKEDGVPLLHTSGNTYPHQNTNSISWELLHAYRVWYSRGNFCRGNIFTLIQKHDY